MTATTIAPLPVAQSQLVFRAVMEALARPGTVHRLPAIAAAAGGPPQALLPLLALADLGTPACVLADDGEWADVVRAMTSAPAAGLAQARLVAALRPVTADELASLRTGTAAAPEDGALACLSVASIRPLPDGGTPDGEGASDGGLLAAAIRAGHARHAGVSSPGCRPGSWPCGASRLMAASLPGPTCCSSAPDGAMTGLPRTTTCRRKPLMKFRMRGHV